MAQQHQGDSANRSHYQQQLDRALGVAGNVVIILGAVAPAVTLFVWMPIMYFLFGGFTFTALLIGLAFQIPLALCYAELGSAYPIAGGEYAMISRSTNRGFGFGIFGMMFIFFIMILATGGIGAGLSLQALWPAVDPKIVAVIIIVAGALLGVANIKGGRIFSGILLVFQLIAIGTVVVLGLMHAHNPVDRLFSTQVWAPDGSIVPLTFSLSLGAITLGFFMFAGYGNAVAFAEETTGPKRNMAKAVLYPLFIIAAVLLVSVACVLIGAPSLVGLSTAPVPMTYFIEALGGATLNKVINVLVFACLTEFVMLTILIVGRQLWSASRDKAWPGPISRALAAVHPRFKTPWVATIVVAVIAVPFCFAELASLVTIQAAVTIIYSAGMAIGALRIRFMKDAPSDRWKMPLWPLPPVVALVGLGFMLYEQTTRDLVITAILLGVSLVYYLVFLLPRRNTNWVMLGAPAEEAGEPATPAATSIGAVAAEDV